LNRVSFQAVHAKKEFDLSKESRTPTSIVVATIVLVARMIPLLRGLSRIKPVGAPQYL